MKYLWTCKRCREVWSTVQAMTSEISDLHNTVQAMTSEISELHSAQNQMLHIIKNIEIKLSQETDAKIKAENEVAKMKAEVSELNKKLSCKCQLSEEPVTQNKTNRTSTRINGNDQAPGKPPEQPTLLLGTSLIRNIDPKKLVNCDVITKGDATIADLHLAITSIPEDKTYKEIIVVGGSFDLEDNEVNDIITDYQALTVSASLKTDKLTICSILPRMDKDYKRKTSQVNKELEKICNDEGHHFKDLDSVFLLRNDMPNDAYLLEDGIHLSKSGVNKLVAECNILTRSASVFCEVPCRKQATPLLFKGPNHPLSNFYKLEEGLKINGKIFPTAEAAYVYEKAIYNRDFNAAKAVCRSTTGIQAKRIGDRIQTGARWQEKKLDIMDNIVRAKIENCISVQQILEESGSRELVEDTTHEFWGHGKENKGQNMLGELWSMYRDKLQRSNIFKPEQHHWATRSSQPRCYRCNETGHLIQQCHHRTPVMCWGCGKQGHKQNHCHIKQHRPQTKVY